MYKPSRVELRARRECTTQTQNNNRKLKLIGFNPSTLDGVPDNRKIATNAQRGQYFSFFRSYLPSHALKLLEYSFNLLG